MPRNRPDCGLAIGSEDPSRNALLALGHVAGVARGFDVSIRSRLDGRRIADMGGAFGRRSAVLAEIPITGEHAVALLPPLRRAEELFEAAALAVALAVETRDARAWMQGDRRRVNAARQVQRIQGPCIELLAALQAETTKRLAAERSAESSDLDPVLGMLARVAGIQVGTTHLAAVADEARPQIAATLTRHGRRPLPSGTGVAAHRRASASCPIGRAGGC